MIKTNLYEPVISINSKPNNPNTGDVYFDTTINRSYMFDSGSWKELFTLKKNPLFNRERIRKINNIFNEENN